MLELAPDSAPVIRRLIPPLCDVTSAGRSLAFRSWSSASEQFPPLTASRAFSLNSALRGNLPVLPIVKAHRASLAGCDQSRSGPSYEWKGTAHFRRLIRVARLRMPGVAFPTSLSHHRGGRRAGLAVARLCQVGAGKPTRNLTCAAGRWLALFTRETRSIPSRRWSGGGGIRTYEPPYDGQRFSRPSRVGFTPQRRSRRAAATLQSPAGSRRRCGAVPRRSGSLRHRA